MGLAKPTGEYVGSMLDADGWPDVDEDLFRDRAEELAGVLRQINDVAESCLRQRSEIFDEGIWSGGAAKAANAEFQTRIDGLTALQNGLSAVINWHNYIVASIVQAKADVTDNVDNACQQINSLADDSSLKASERENATHEVVIAAHAANVSVVQGAAELILASKSMRPPSIAFADPGDPNIPQPVTPPDKPDNPGDDDDHKRHPPKPVIPPVSPIAPAPFTPVSPVTPSEPPVAPDEPIDGPGGEQPNPSAPVVPKDPKPEPKPDGAPVEPHRPAAPLRPAASAPSTVLGVIPAALSMPSPAAQPRVEDKPAPGAPAMPGGPMAPAAVGGGGRSAAGSGRAPAHETAGDKTSTPAAARRPAPRPVGATFEEPLAPGDQHDMAMMAPIPVSAARAERDAIADAATPDAARRQADPLKLARRIAAALNAPGGGGQGDMGFFWLTAVTTDGVILVANSYGLAYIPNGVELPDQVVMASADGAIPAAERARWATYPVLAVQGWATHHEKKLRAVIATADQMVGSDPGTTTVLLEPEDIPEKGDMTGRSRLEVVDSEGAQRLAATPDPALAALLPPAALATGTAPRPSRLWLEVMKPLAMNAASRQAEHLKALRAYADAAQETCLTRAREAGAPVLARPAIADWLYWKHLAGLLDSAATPGK